MKITENAPSNYKLQYLNPPHLYHSILIAQSKHTHYSSICIISYLSICIAFRQVHTSEVPNAMLFCYPTSTVASQSLAVTAPSHGTGTELFLWNAPAGSSVVKGSHVGCTSLAPALSYTHTTLRPSTTASSI